MTSRDWEGGMGRLFRELSYSRVKQKRELCFFIEFYDFGHDIDDHMCEDENIFGVWGNLKKKREYYYFGKKINFSVKIMHICEIIGV